MASVTTECFGLHETLARIQQLDSMSIQTMCASPFQQISQSISAFFYGCSMTLSVVEEYAMELNDAVQNDRPGKAALNQNSDLLKLWKENDMQELLSQIREYRKRLSDLLQAVEAGRAEPEDDRTNTKDHASIAGLLSRSRLSFLAGTTSPRSSLRDSILSLDPSPPYALSLYAYSEKAATRSIENLFDDKPEAELTPEAELLPQGDATAPISAQENSEDTVDEGSSTSEASPFGRSQFPQLSSNAKDNRPLVVSERYNSDLDQPVNWEGGDLNSVAPNPPRNLLLQLPEHLDDRPPEDIEDEPLGEGAVDAQRDRNFSRPLATSSAIEVPSDEEWSKPLDLEDLMFRGILDELTTYRDNKPLELASRISSHGSPLLPTKDHTVDREVVLETAATNTASDSTQSRDLMDHGFQDLGGTHTADEAMDRNQVTYLSWTNKATKPCPKLPSNYRYKIAVIGDDDSGKDTLINQFLGRSNDDEDPGSEDFHCKKCKIDGRDIIIEIVDFSPQESYHSMWDNRLRSIDGFLLVYSMISRRSMAYIVSLSEKINRINTCNSVGRQWPKVFMANNSGNEALREVSREEGRALALEKGSVLIKSSSTNEETNLKAAFYYLVRDICRLYDQDRLYNPNPACLCDGWIEKQQKAFAPFTPPVADEPPTADEPPAANEPPAVDEPPASQRSLRGIFGRGRFPIRSG